MKSKNSILFSIFLFLTPIFLHAGFWKKRQKKIAQSLPKDTTCYLAQLPEELKSLIAFYCCINDMHKKYNKKQKYELDDLKQKLYYKKRKKKIFKAERPIYYWPGKITGFDFIYKQIFLLITYKSLQTIVLEGSEDTELYRNISNEKKIIQFTISSQPKLLCTLEKKEKYQWLSIYEYKKELKKFNNEPFKFYELPADETYVDINYNPELDMIMLLNNNKSIKYFTLSDIDFTSDNFGRYLRKNLICKFLS